ncbi:MAG: class I SAM-dependent methyltransferase [Cyanobacteria bacterium P01_A01_bin.45]
MKGIAQKPVARPVTPLGILAKQLEEIVQTTNQLTDIPAEVKAQISFAYRLATGLDPYLEKVSTTQSASLASLADKTAYEAWNQRFSDGTTVRQLEQEMLSGHVEGQALKMFVHMSSAKRILEIGMFTGYSALAMAEALPADGKLIACEVDPYAAEFGEKAFKESEHGLKIKVEVGSALDTLNKLAKIGESFDLVFIDADKKEYVQYFQILLDTDLLVPGGFILVDNTLLQGQPYLPSNERTPNGDAIAQFNQAIASDPRVEQVLLPLRDGLTIIRRLPN